MVPADGSHPYVVRRPSESTFLTIRGLRYHVRRWGSPEWVRPESPALVMLHGWMDVGASFQFVVDAMVSPRYVLAPDWRGFGLSQAASSDSYWFADYLGDLDALLDELLPGQQVDLLGHSMGGNVAMLYAGIRPQRIRRLVNLEGFGLPASQPDHAPKHYAAWLDELKMPQSLHPYPSLEAVAQRLRRNNPLLRPELAAWLAPHWARQRDDGWWEILADPAHKRRHAVLYRKEEALACWAAITAPVLWVEGDRTDMARWWGQRYSRAEFEERLQVVRQLQRRVLSPAGHMLHHDQPEALAAHLEAFLR
ncbi:MAG: alpha/beta hydrolase [Caldimonas manganoxidans]|uniref:alpha/beta fold hydrolase n=1 Tax=Caldimonas taiwanensis TaxID=307483 RepID=UPI000781F78E|nr:alpha/beta hydrolase [Caldimonas taiwanensis]MCX7660348.1 alpha/beta hydrolase [Caldimonas manganoxidans]